jgi:hypothetical protein
MAHNTWLLTSWLVTSERRLDVEWFGHILGAHFRIMKIPETEDFQNLG